MTMPDTTAAASTDAASAGAGLRPEELAEAAEAPIEDAKGRAPRDAARVLAEAGLTGVAAAEADGGLGLPIAFALPIAEAAGRLQLRFPLVEQILLARAFAGITSAGSCVAGAIAAGERVGTIAWQGSLAEGLAGPARFATDCDWVLMADGSVAGADPRGAVLLDVSGLDIVTDDALDPDVPQAWLRPGAADRRSGGHAPDSARIVARLPADAWARLRAEARILLAGFVTGAAQGAIARTAAHVATRVQFGRPLSARQAVRHALARMQLQMEVSAAATRRVLATDESGAPRDPRPTFAGAIANATFILEKAIHLHGGMGFTWEVPLHHSLRDIRAIDAALAGTAAAKAIGRRFIASV